MKIENKKKTYSLRLNPMWVDRLREMLTSSSDDDNLSAWVRRQIKSTVKNAMDAARLRNKKSGSNGNSSDS